jgi:phosphoribosylamine--glycine ligase
MNILVVGAGGREHALAWKIAQSPKATKVYCAPGNGGTRLVAENVPIPDSNVARLADFALQAGIDLTVVGPEVPLSLGIVDEFEKKGLRIFGPSKKAAELEWSKVFAKRFMARHKIPTGRFKVADSADKARAVLRSGEFGWPVVLKADGLAAGKGVIIAKTPEEAETAVGAIMVERQFGAAGGLLLIEEFLLGREVSFIVIADGTRVLPLVTTMDHKAAFDGNRGPNTGGMGTISPSPYLNKALFAEVMEGIVLPTVTRMKEEGRTYKGALYCGLMLTSAGPRVLEYNCRFGDPETQPQMLRLESDLLDILLSCVEENVLAEEIHWSEKAAACVILASEGYPGPYARDKVIRGLDAAAERPGITIFQAGTKIENKAMLTNGGRVLAVCAADRELAGAMNRIYEAVAEIQFEGMHFRRDIGALSAEE